MSRKCKEYVSKSMETAENRLEEPPDLVLLDWMLPDINGVDVCRMLTEQYRIPIIMLTARGSVEDKLYGLESGADDYITKPFDLREVVASITRMSRKCKEYVSKSMETAENRLDISHPIAYTLMRMILK